MDYAATILGRLPGGKRGGIDGLKSKLGLYMPPEHVAEVSRAYDFGAQAHEGQKRLSGEPFISHPVAVASILADLHLDRDTVTAAILHDVIEDTPTLKEQLEEMFNKDVAELVDGVSKLDQLQFRSKAEAQAESFRKMLLAMVRDIRVIMVKLADRLHNMRTLGVMRPDKRRRIARETLEIYAPIANRLGINNMKVELEDLGFHSLYPNRYSVLEKAVKQARGNQKQIVRKISKRLEKALSHEKIEAAVHGREKHLYSIYKKMRRTGLTFNEIVDVYGFRIQTASVDDCYRVLGVVHNLFRPAPGQFDDYIAIPKANGYQSLHTSLIGPGGVPIEVQIRTEDMHKVAESGIAAHWTYKAGDSSAAAQQKRAREWLKGVMDLQEGLPGSEEFLEHVKVDLFPDKVYVFTPTGDIMRLPRGATPVDFAYAVHTDIGSTCVGARVDRRLVPLRTPLENGQSIEIITEKKARPNPAWLNFVVTAKARAGIRNYIKHLKRDDAVSLGRRMLGNALQEIEHSIDAVNENLLKDTLSDFGLETLDDLYEKIALGERLAPIVARRLGVESDDSNKESKPLAISGTEGMVVNLARCCHPLPGDQIMGYLSSGRGIVVHRMQCGNVAEYRSQPEKWIDVEWQKTDDQVYPSEVRIEAINQRGVLASIAAGIADMGSNIEHVNVLDRDGDITSITFVLDVEDVSQLERVMRKVKNMNEVVEISRACT